MPGKLWQLHWRDTQPLAQPLAQLLTEPKFFSLYWTFSWRLLRTSEWWDMLCDWQLLLAVRILRHQCFVLRHRLPVRIWNMHHNALAISPSLAQTISPPLTHTISPPFSNFVTSPVPEAISSPIPNPTSFAVAYAVPNPKSSHVYWCRWQRRELWICQRLLLP